MSRSDERYDSSKKRKTKREHPTNAELLGFGGIIAGVDKTGNVEHLPSDVPARRFMPGRGDPADSLDRFSPEADSLEYDFSDDDDDFEDACPEIETQPAVAANTQGDPGRMTPSIFHPGRFVHQGGSKK